MARAKPVRSPVEAYINARPAAVRRKLKEVQRAIRGALPDAQETISYKMPAYRVHGRIALYFAAWDEHFALYPANPKLIKAFGPALAPYAVGKGTIRFAYAQPVPAGLIARIARLRARQIAERTHKTPARTTARRPAASAKVRRPRRRQTRVRARRGGRTARGSCRSGSATAIRS